MTDINQGGNSRSHSTESELLACAETGQLVGVSECLQHGVDLHAKDPATGQTALHKASVSGDLEMINFLLEHGASVGEPDKEGLTALHLACGAGDQPAVVQALMQREGFVDRVDGEGMSPLMVAASAGHEEIVILLLAQGAYVQLTAKDGQTAADMAPKRRIKALIKAEQGRREENLLKEEGLDATAAAARWRAEYEAKAAAARSELAAEQTERARLKRAKMEAEEATAAAARAAAAEAQAEAEAAAAANQAIEREVAAVEAELIATGVKRDPALPRLPKGFQGDHLERRLEFSRARVYVPWGRQVLLAIEKEDTATLLTIFHDKKHLGADINAQADIEKVGG